MSAYYVDNAINGHIINHEPTVLVYDSTKMAICIHLILHRLEEPLSQHESPCGILCFETRLCTQ